MNNFSIEMFPASYGDSFLVTCGDQMKTNILIDAGFQSTYHNSIKKRLAKISSLGKNLSLLVFTHIDADHISGGIPLLIENGTSEDPKIIKIEHIWHNSYKHIQFDKKRNGNDNTNDDLDRKCKEIIRGILLKNYPKEKTKSKERDISNPISAKQGSSLASYILEGEYNWNKHFNEKAILADDVPQIRINSEVCLTLLSPLKDDLTKMEKKWKNELKSKGFKEKNTGQYFDDAFEFLLSREKKVKEKDIQKKISYSYPDIDKLILEGFIEDTSTTNGSSISFILKYNGKKVLFLADSHSSVIEKSLKKIFTKNEFPVHFDLIKVSHHGGKKNTSPGLLEMIDSENYLISTNGIQYKHPDLVTLARIVTRESSKERRLFFNYETEASKFMDNPSLMKKHNYSVVNSEEHKSQVISI